MCYVTKILIALYIIFISLFALDELGIGRSTVGFIIHLIPTAILILATAILWKWPKIGGSIFILLGIFYVIEAWSDSILACCIISGPLFLIGVCAIIFCYKEKVSSLTKKVSNKIKLKSKTKNKIKRNKK